MPATEADVERIVMDALRRGRRLQSRRRRSRHLVTGLAVVVLISATIALIGTAPGKGRSDKPIGHSGPAFNAWLSVRHGTSDEVLPVDTSTGTVGRPIPIRGQIGTIYASPATQAVYVLSAVGSSRHGRSLLTSLNTATLRVTGAVEFPERNTDLQFGRDGRTLYVLNSDAAGSGWLEVVDLGSLTVMRKMRARGQILALAWRTHRLFVLGPSVSGIGEQLTVMDSRTLRRLATISTPHGGGWLGVTATPSGRTAVVEGNDSRHQAIVQEVSQQTGAPEHTFTIKGWSLAYGGRFVSANQLIVRVQGHGTSGEPQGMAAVSLEGHPVAEVAVPRGSYFAQTCSGLGIEAALAPILSGGYSLVNKGPQGIEWIDATSGSRIGSLRLQAPAQSFAVDESTHTLYLTAASAQDRAGRFEFLVVDSDTSRVVRRILLPFSPPTGTAFPFAVAGVAPLCG